MPVPLLSDGSGPMSVLLSVAEFMASLRGAAVLTGGIVAEALYLGVKHLYRPLRQARRAIAECSSVVLDRLGDPPVPEHLEHVSDGLRDRSAWSRAWEEFRATLVLDAFASPEPAVRRTRSAMEFFDDGRIFAEYFDLRQLHAIPNVLVGSGILGTFIGLSLGVYLANQGLTLNRLDVMRASLAQLLGGASAAFLTSVAGLAGSLLIGWMIRDQLHKLGQSLHRLARAIDLRIPPVTAEHLLAEALKEARQQSAELKHFNTTLAVSVAEALDERMASRLVPKLEQVLAAIDRLREEQVMFNQESLTRILSQFQQSLDRAAAREMEALATTIRQAREGLAEAGEALSHHRESVTASLNAAVAHFESSVQLLTDRLALAGAPMVEAARRWAESVARVEAVVHQVTQTAEVVERALTDAAVAIRTAGESVRGSVADVQAVLKSATGLLESSSGVARDMTQATGQLRTAADGLSQTAAALRLQTEALTSTWEHQKERFQGLDDELGRAFDRLSAGMRDALDQAAAVLGRAHDHLAEALSTLAAFVSELQETVDTLEHVNGRLRGARDGADH